MEAMADTITGSDTNAHGATGADRAAQVGELAGRVRSEIERVIVGQAATVDTAIACVLARGHLLIEDIPGVGKTLLAQALAASIGGSFHRIQGTPDLLPGDVTGSMMPTGDGHELRFRAGPVFSNIVVFDELNRANPRTQSALLEATEESAVTVDGTTRELPSPFLVVATQNPLEMVGTYPLSEGALDRFMAVVTPGRPGADAEVDVLAGRRGRTQLADVVPVVDIDDIVDGQRAVAGVHIADPVARWVVDVLAATREHPHVRLGASTRGGVALVNLAKARAAMSGRHFVIPDDVIALAVPSLAHRIVVANAAGSVEAGREVVAECVARVPAPTV